MDNRLLWVNSWVQAECILCTPQKIKGIGGKIIKFRDIATSNLLAVRFWLFFSRKMLLNIALILSNFFFIKKNTLKMWSAMFIGKDTHKITSAMSIGKDTHKLWSAMSIGKDTHEMWSAMSIGKDTHKMWSAMSIGKDIH